MRFFFVLWIALVLSIASLFAQDSLALANDKVDVYIIRNNVTNVINALSTFSFYHNDSFIGTIKGLKYLKCKFSPGKQLFWTAAENKAFLEVDLKLGETYIIEAQYKMGFSLGWAKLRLVSPNTDEYTFLKNKIEKKEPQKINPKEIEGKNILLKDYILRVMTKYEKRKQREMSFKSEAINAPHPTVSRTDTLTNIVAPIQLDYNFVDFPSSNKSMEISGIKGLITNPSMSQSLNIATSVNSLTREGLYRIMSKRPSTKRYYGLSACFLDLLSILPIPLTSSWMHEEFHRAVLAKHGGNSYNEMNDFPIFKSLISVLNVKDEDLIRLKRESPQDMVRMSEAGIEGQYLMANNINKSIFFNNPRSKSFLPLYTTMNSIMYVLMCSLNNIDNETNTLNITEGNNIAKRDLVGLDFLAYTYDLFRPSEPYESRGIHPSGVGINRYIKRSQLTTEEKSYLKQQGLLQLINLVNPISLMLNSFDIGGNVNGDKTRVNLYFNHWLTSFGYDISSTGLLHYNKNNYAFTFHNFVNHAQWMPGVELETYDCMIGRGVIKKPIPVTARVMAWLQPENQLFFSNKMQLGGLIEAKIQYPLFKYINPYISVTAKTNGWVAGNVYLEENLSCSLGLRASF